MAEEAAKLADVVHLWLRDRSAAAAAASAAAGAAGAADAADDAVPAAECRTCPVCRARRLAASLDPEVLAHLSDAAASLGAAVRAASRRRGSTGT
jgi:hypothetical protein